MKLVRADPSKSLTALSPVDYASSMASPFLPLFLNRKKSYAGVCISWCCCEEERETGMLLEFLIIRSALPRGECPA